MFRILQFNIAFASDPDRDSINNFSVGAGFDF